MTAVFPADSSLHGEKMCEVLFKINSEPDYQILGVSNISRKLGLGSHRLINFFS